MRQREIRQSCHQPTRPPGWHNVPETSGRDRYRRNDGNRTGAGFFRLPWLVALPAPRMSGRSGCRLVLSSGGFTKRGCLGLRRDNKRHLPVKRGKRRCSRAAKPCRLFRGRSTTGVARAGRSEIARRTASDQAPSPRRHRPRPCPAMRNAAFQKTAPCAADPFRMPRVRGKRLLQRGVEFPPVGRRRARHVNRHRPPTGAGGAVMRWRVAPRQRARHIAVPAVGIDRGQGPCRLDPEPAATGEPDFGSACSGNNLIPFGIKGFGLIRRDSLNCADGTARRTRAARSPP